MKKSIAALLMTFVLTGCMGHHQMHKKHQSVLLQKGSDGLINQCVYSDRIYGIGSTTKFDDGKLYECTIDPHFPVQSNAPRIDVYWGGMRI